MTPVGPNPPKGIALMLMAVTLFTIMTALIKAADRIPAGEAVFFRASMSIPLILIWLATQRSVRIGIRVGNWRSHALRGLAGSCAMGLGFAGLRYLPLPEVTAIRFVTPVLLVVFAALILGERFRMIRMGAVIAGLIGVVIITLPRVTATGEAAALFGIGLTLASATLAALAQVFLKKMAGSEETTAIVFWFSLTATALSLLTLPFGWVVPQGMEWVYLIGAGLVGGVGQILLTTSYRYAEAGVLAPFTYVSMIWAVLIGWIVFDEVPTLAMLAGAALIIAAGVVIVLRERKVGGVVAEGNVRAKRFS